MTSHIYIRESKLLCCEKLSQFDVSFIRLLKILCNSLAMLRQLTPDICGILIDQVTNLILDLRLWKYNMQASKQRLSCLLAFVCNNIYAFVLFTGYGPGRVPSPALSRVQFANCGQRGAFVVWYSFGLPQHGPLQSWPCEFGNVCSLARMIALPQAFFFSERFS